jgi:hypothetical protein
VQIAVARWLTGQFGGTPDSPVNYSGARLRTPESGCLDSVRSWCTGHCPVAHRIVQRVVEAEANHKSMHGYLDKAEASTRPGVDRARALLVEKENG